jgi:uncharacterized membrane protein (UPF0182 family)
MGASWRTTLMSIVTGVITLLLGIPVFVQAVTDWSHHLPVDWRSVLTTTALAAITAGLALAKDFNVHGGSEDTGTRPPAAVTQIAVEKVAEAKVEAKKP